MVTGEAIPGMRHRTAAPRYGVARRRRGACNGSDDHGSACARPEGRAAVPSTAPLPRRRRPRLALRILLSMRRERLSRPTSPWPSNASRPSRRWSRTASASSIWVDGLGEIGAHEPDTPLFSASNQKLLTAMGVLAVLGPDAVHHRGPVDPGRQPSRGHSGRRPVAHGQRDHTRSNALAAQVRTAGITTVRRPRRGRVAPGLCAASCRLAGLAFPACGPLSALMVDRNRYRLDAAFLADPDRRTASYSAALRSPYGVRVAGPTVHGSAPTAPSSRR